MSRSYAHKIKYWAVLGLSLPLIFACATEAIAQLSAAKDGTGTTVNQQGNNFTIGGGSLSGDSANLFHNFADFNLNSSQTATFLGNPALHNILSKVSGGNPSYIDGRLRVSGSDANLFLLNSSGIVFGTNAQLDLSGSFTAATASNVGFASGEWLNNGNYANLVGTPTLFSFDGIGAMINGADLQVNAGRSLHLFASNIVNTGTLAAEQGNIQVIAIPANNTLRLNQAGQILGLELPISTTSWNIVDLPELLTGTTLDTGLVVDGNTVQLAADGTIIPQNAGSTFLNGLLSTVGNTGGEINLFGQAIALHDATIDVSGTIGGGKLLMGGDYQGLGEFPHAQTTSVNINSFLKADAIDAGNGGEIIVWSDARTDFDGFLSATGGFNNGDGGFAEISSKSILDIASGWSRRITLDAPNGLSGNLLLDPTNITILAEPPSSDSIIGSPFQPNATSTLLDSDIVDFLDGIPEIRAGADLTITTAGNGGDQGNIVVQENANITWFSNSSLTLLADNNIQIAANVDFAADGTGDLTLDAGNQIISDSDLWIGGGDLTLKAVDDIKVEGLFSFFSGGGASNILAQSETGSIFTGAIAIPGFSGDAGSVVLTAKGDIEVEFIDASNLDGNGGTIDIFTEGFFRATGTSFLSGSGEEFSLTTVSEVFTESPIGDSGGEMPALASGGIRIEHGGQGITPFIVGDAAINGTEGSIISGTIINRLGMEPEGFQSEGGNRIVPTETYFDTYIQGDIEIITTAVPEPSMVEPPVIPDLPDCFPDCAREKPSRSIPTGTQEEEIKGENPRDTLKFISEATGQEPAILYVYTEMLDGESADPETVSVKNLGEKANLKVLDGEGETQWEYSGDRLTDYLNNATYNFLNPRATLNEDAVLNLVLVTPDGEFVRRRVAGINRRELMTQAQAFIRSVSNPRSSTAYLKPAQFLYNAIIAPIEAELDAKNINNLSFILDDGLRTLPVAALHDGEQFLVEKYSLGLMPSFSLTNTAGYLPPKENQLLALGASEFDDQQDLPAAPLEVEIITQEIWPRETSTFLNQQFTVDNLLSAREKRAYGIVHLATHGEFSSGGVDSSYIQFHNQRVTLGELAQLRLGDPPIELLVLSACRTAIGDRRSELGFAGLALYSGAKAAIGSIWYVSDVGTMGLMAKFYDELQRSPIKAEALQQAQIALLNNQVRIEDFTLRIDDRIIPLPDEIRGLRHVDLSHPFYWGGFTLVGNPW
ncbi:CHAT domain-containing protein [[Limnothrix rosea] IAM M-220]|uniref:CHAT domain-containing protein n=1 Tax=[Limnothrix rosea] IAM M-220 TaxID=454133 RepID=UPI000962F714|nr:CHAT domain-containing protein [[Limnothrix rosea] IAM M-220]OKH18948.1 hypothetical protein NIES208_04335 [[Limnothrix rosea] IAM M-220]